MVKIYGKCEGCKKNRFFIRVRRYYKIPRIGTLKGRDEICGKCHKNIKIMIQKQNG